MNKTYHLRRIDNITSDIALQIQHLSDICQGYEPFFDSEDNTGFIYIGVFDATETLIGFASGLDLEDYVEVTALVHPAHRRQGIFKAMIKVIKEYCNKTLVGTICPEILNMLSASSLAPVFSHSELLMTYANTTNIDSVLPDSFECLFTDDCDNYLMYEVDDDEPVAVCNLDFTESFTNISGVYVDECKRGHGLGTLFMKELIRNYFEEFDTPLILHVSSLNTAALKLYEKCGFETVDTINYYIL